MNSSAPAYVDFALYMDASASHVRYERKSGLAIFKRAWQAVCSSRGLGSPPIARRSDKAPQARTFLPMSSLS
jgi:hypothetical protein